MVEAGGGRVFFFKRRPKNGPPRRFYFFIVTNASLLAAQKYKLITKFTAASILSINHVWQINRKQSTLQESTGAQLVRFFGF
jgi:hypothetical protein